MSIDLFNKLNDLFTNPAVESVLYTGDAFTKVASKFTSPRPALIWSNSLAMSMLEFINNYEWTTRSTLPSQYPLTLTLTKYATTVCGHSAYLFDHPYNDALTWDPKEFYQSFFITDTGFFSNQSLINGT